VANPNQNEVLANFFQNLLSKKNVTAPTSSNESTANPVTKQANGPNNGVPPSRKMVEKELDKLRNIPATSMAGK
jgi:hypothetical protein